MVGNGRARDWVELSVRLMTHCLPGGTCWAMRDICLQPRGEASNVKSVPNLLIRGMEALVGLLVMSHGEYLLMKGFRDTETPAAVLRIEIVDKAVVF
jgi:hypothetical protein